MTAKDFNKTLVPLSGKLYRLAYRYLEDGDQAQDAVQEVFVKLWTIREKMVDIENKEAFAVRVTRNYCLDQIKARRTVSLDVNDYFKDRIEDESDPEKEMFKSDSMFELKRIVTELPEPHQSVLRMKDVEGYSNEEIGEILGLTDGNVRVVLSRARKKVRDSLEKVFNYGSSENRSLIAEIL